MPDLCQRWSRALIGSNRRRTEMIPKFALSMLVALAVCGPVQEAAAQESTLGGALFGGAAGAIVGGALGGGRRAAAGRLPLLSGRLLCRAARRLAGSFTALLRCAGAIRTSAAPVL